MIKFAQAKNVGAVDISISYLNNSVVNFATFMCVAFQSAQIVMCNIKKTIKNYNNKYYELE